MSPPTVNPRFDRPLGELYRATQAGVVTRLSDPYLTEHDRWVLRQFARFLAGRAPAPDPRVAPRRPMPVASPHVRRLSL